MLFQNDANILVAIVIITALFVLPLMAGEISYWFWQLIKLVNKDYYNKEDFIFINNSQFNQENIPEAIDKAIPDFESIGD